ncbi:L-rhamnose mutarotase [Streptomyces sp. QHH-9511]|uniref:L-rhamnose mutarotase n=1 Tax=Streptomyces sp. QHH-9511 TaxID=2684468 RepID=UPI0013165513|nr:L-rhamnose mutarotase [Streptomyces sp. QHH-9511]QGZ52472.1 L-rhamnose mutarotase [Streptomyces sp. QHH-9511]
MKVPPHTKVRADRIEEYDAAHRQVPEELTAAIRAAGVSEWTIRRGGTDLFHVLEVLDYQAMIAALERRPADIAWQARTAEPLDVVHDYSAQGAEASLPAVREL